MYVCESNGRPRRRLTPEELLDADAVRNMRLEDEAGNSVFTPDQAIGLTGDPGSSVADGSGERGAIQRQFLATLVHAARLHVRRASTVEQDKQDDDRDVELAHEAMQQELDQEATDNEGSSGDEAVDDVEENQPAEAKEEKEERRPVHTSGDRGTPHVCSPVHEYRVWGVMALKSSNKPDCDTMISKALRQRTQDWFKRLQAHNVDLRLAECAATALPRLDAEENAEWLEMEPQELPDNVTARDRALYRCAFIFAHRAPSCVWSDEEIVRVWLARIVSRLGGSKHGRCHSANLGIMHTKKCGMRGSFALFGEIMPGFATAYLCRPGAQANMIISFSKIEASSRFGFTILCAGWESLTGMVLRDAQHMATHGLDAGDVRQTLQARGKTHFDTKEAATQDGATSVREIVIDGMLDMHGILVDDDLERKFAYAVFDWISCMKQSPDHHALHYLLEFLEHLQPNKHLHTLTRFRVDEEAAADDGKHGCLTCAGFNACRCPHRLLPVLAVLKQLLSQQFGHFGSRYQHALLCQVFHYASLMRHKSDAVARVMMRMIRQSFGGISPVGHANGAGIEADAANESYAIREMRKVLHNLDLSWELLWARGVGHSRQSQTRRDGQAAREQLHKEDVLRRRQSEPARQIYSARYDGCVKQWDALLREALSIGSKKTAAERMFIPGTGGQTVNTLALRAFRSDGEAEAHRNAWALAIAPVRSFLGHPLGRVRSTWTTLLYKSDGNKNDDPGITRADREKRLKVACNEGRTIDVERVPGNMLFTDTKGKSSAMFEMLLYGVEGDAKVDNGEDQQRDRVLCASETKSMRVLLHEIVGDKPKVILNDAMGQLRMRPAGLPAHASARTCADAQIEAIGRTLVGGSVLTVVVLDTVLFDSFLRIFQDLERHIDDLVSCLYQRKHAHGKGMFDKSVDEIGSWSIDGKMWVSWSHMWSQKWGLRLAYFRVLHAAFREHLWGPIAHTTVLLVGGTEEVSTNQRDVLGVEGRPNLPWSHLVDMFLAILKQAEAERLVARSVLDLKDLLYPTTGPFAALLGSPDTDTLFHGLAVAAKLASMAGFNGLEDGAFAGIEVLLQPAQGSKAKADELRTRLAKLGIQLGAQLGTVMTLALNGTWLFLVHITRLARQLATDPTIPGQWYEKALQPGAVYSAVQCDLTKKPRGVSFRLGFDVLRSRAYRELADGAGLFPPALGGAAQHPGTCVPWLKWTTLVLSQAVAKGTASWPRPWTKPFLQGAAVAQLLGQEAMVGGPLVWLLRYPQTRMGNFLTSESLFQRDSTGHALFGRGAGATDAAALGVCNGYRYSVAAATANGWPGGTTHTAVTRVVAMYGLRPGDSIEATFAVSGSHELLDVPLDDVTPFALHFKGAPICRVGGAGAATRGRTTNLPLRLRDMLEYYQNQLGGLEPKFSSFQFTSEMNKHVFDTDEEIDDVLTSSLSAASRLASLKDAVRRNKVVWKTLSGAKTLAALGQGSTGKFAEFVPGQEGDEFVELCAMVPVPVEAENEVLATTEVVAEGTDDRTDQADNVVPLDLPEQAADITLKHVNDAVANQNGNADLVSCALGLMAALAKHVLLQQAHAATSNAAAAAAAGAPEARGVQQQKQKKKKKAAAKPGQKAAAVPGQAKRTRGHRTDTTALSTSASSAAAAKTGRRATGGVRGREASVCMVVVECLCTGRLQH